MLYESERASFSVGERHGTRSGLEAGSAATTGVVPTLSSFLFGQHKLPLLECCLLHTLYVCLTFSNLQLLLPVKHFYSYSTLSDMSFHSNRV